MTDDLARIAADEQTTAFMRDQRKRARAIAGDIATYHTALQVAGIKGELLDSLTDDFGGKWHDYQLGDEIEINVAALYAEGDE